MSTEIIVGIDPIVRGDGVCSTFVTLNGRHHDTIESVLRASRELLEHYWG